MWRRCCRDQERLHLYNASSHAIRYRAHSSSSGSGTLSFGTGGVQARSVRFHLIRWKLLQRATGTLVPPRETKKINSPEKNNPTEIDTQCRKSQTLWMCLILWLLVSDINYLWVRKLESQCSITIGNVACDFVIRFIWLFAEARWDKQTGTYW